MAKTYPRILLLLVTLLGISNDALALSTLLKSDPYPIFTTLDPETFLETREKLKLKGYDIQPSWLERFSFSLSAFGQNACIGRIDAECIPPIIKCCGNECDASGPKPIIQSCVPGTRVCDETATQLGDMEGRWGMIGLLYGNVPATANNCCGGMVTTVTLACAGLQGNTAIDGLQTTLCPGKDNSASLLTSSALAQAINCLGFNPDSKNGIKLDNPEFIDNNQEVGFFSIPMSYRKRGARFQVDARIYGDFGMSVQTSVAETCQLVKSFTNLTPGPLTNGNDVWNGNSGCITVSKCLINTCLMDQIKIIAEEINLNIERFNATSIEEVRINGYWRHAFEINKNEDEWPEFLLIPFFQASFSASPGKRKNVNKAFGLPFGNNGHNAAGFDAGINMDFYDTIEIGGEMGYTHFFKRSHVPLRVPNSPCQSGIYPYCTNVCYQPGTNWSIAAKLSAYHFLANLSMYFQYLLVMHKQDKICLMQPDKDFFPELLERRSDWKTQMANIGFNYDFSPHIGLGFLWQAPLHQQNVYRSSTLLFSFNVNY
ncbi:MAG: hypothetical protein NTX86_05150 [Candidatus Dependentiae bacterium]|nr:hypothetical protein [Candidatus Dependentiae bacterium]